MKRIRSGVIDISVHVRAFAAEMETVGATNETLFVLFGADAARLLKKHWGRTFPRFVAMPHYAVSGSAESWATETLHRMNPN